MKSLSSPRMLVAAVALACGCRDLHLHLYEKHVAAPDAPVTRQVFNVPYCPATMPAGRTVVEDVQTPEEILAEVLGGQVQDFAGSGSAFDEP